MYVRSRARKENEAKSLLGCLSRLDQKEGRRRQGACLGEMVNSPDMHVVKR